MKKPLLVDDKIENHSLKLDVKPGRADAHQTTAKRYLDSDVVLQGSILELRELSKHASFKTKREFAV